MKSPRQNSDCWDQFWRTGRDSCCSEQEDSAHAQRIREQWVELFAGIESNNKVLDLCTGNGAVLRVALECLNRTGFPVALSRPEMFATVAFVAQKSFLMRACVKL